MSEKENDIIEESFNLVRKKFMAKLPEKLLEINEIEKGLSLDNRNIKILKALHQSIHKLSGSSSMFGFAELGEKANELELYLKPIINNNCCTNDQMIHIIKLLDNVKKGFTNCKDK